MECGPGLLYARWPHFHLIDGLLGCFMNFGTFKVWRLYVVAMEVEAKPIIDYYKLLLVNNQTISQFGNLGRKMFGNYFHMLSEKFQIYMNSMDYNSVVVIVGGIGKINASAATTFGIQVFNPSSVYNIGMCGNLSENLKKYEIVKVSKVFQHDMYIPLPGKEFDKLKEIISLMKCNKIKEHDEYTHTHVSLATGDSFIDKDEVKELLKKNSEIVDMEGYAIATVCEIYNVKLTMYKFISDDADSKSQFDFIEAFSQYNKTIRKLLEKL